MAHGYEVVADALRAEGVRTLFGLLGNSNLALAGVLAGHGVPFLSARHETAGVGLAAGCAWATGRPAACTVTHGPGLSNALTGLTSAARDRLPVVLLVGDISAEPEWSAQRVDHRTMLSWTGAELVDCDRPELLAASVATGFRHARADRRPVVVNLRADQLLAEAVPQRGGDPADGAPAPPPGTDVEPAVAALLAAERPLILAGRGAVWAGAGPELRRLAGRCGALLATTLPAKGLFAGDRYDVGVCGAYSTRTARDLITGSDCVLAVGAGLNGYTTDEGKLLAGATLIHCDRSPRGDADLPLAGDGRDVAAALTAGLAGSGPDRTGRRTPDVAARIAAAGDFPDGGDAGGLDPRAVLRAVDRVLPADRQVVVDVGHFTTFPIQLVSVPGPGRFLPTLGFAAVGLSIATGLGAAAGRRIRTLVVVGDGGTLMSLGELETVRRLDLPVTVLVLDDRAYGAEIHHLRRHGLPESLAVFPGTDLAAVARAIGLPAATLATTDDLDRLPATLAEPAGPVLVHARVTTSVVADKFRLAMTETPERPPGEH